MKKSNWIVLLIVGLSLILAGCGKWGATPEPTPAPDPVKAQGVMAEANLVPAKQIALSFAIPGQVSEVLVQEGESVSAGDALARLSDTQSLEAQVASAERAVLQAQQSLDDLNETADLAATRVQVALVQARQDLVDAERVWDAVDNEDYQAKLDDARIEMNDAQDDLEEAEETLADYENLDEDNPTREAAEEDLEQAQGAYDEALWAFEDLQNRFDLAEAQLALAGEALNQAEQRAAETADGPHPDDSALAEASLAEAETQLVAAQAALADATLFAPFDGRVLRLAVKEGQRVSPGSMAMIIADTSEWYLETNDLTEEEVVRINPYEPVSIHFDALPGSTFSGEVESISDYFVEQFGDITYVVRIRLLDENEDIRWGMTAEVSFLD